MIKILGAVLIVGSCSAMGLFMNKGLRDRAAALKSFMSAFEIIKAEIIFRALPLGQIMTILDKEALGSASHFFSSVGAEMEASQLSFSGACSLWVDSLKLYGLGKNDVGCISGALYSLGKYDAATQAEAIDKAVTALDYELGIARNELAQKGKLYRAMGVTIGIMIALIAV